MSFAIPHFSRKQVTRAGAVLIDENSTDEERSDALEVLNHWRSCHAYPVNTFQATLRSRLKRICPHALVAQRLKRTPSIEKKLKLNPGMQMVRMQDIGGIRAVVQTLAQVRKLERLYTEDKLTHELVKIDDYITTPKHSGYRSLHLIYKYRNPKNPIYNDLCVELQIRTKLQHTWATAVETIGTFLGQALKSSEGSEEWLSYFKLVGAAFSLLEGTPVPEEFKEFSDFAIYQETIKQTDHLEVQRKLRAFAVAANQIETRQSKGNYHLVILDSHEKNIEVISFGLKRLETANEMYAKIEKRSEKDPYIQAVLVATTSIESLKRAYPNFFLDTREFFIALSKIQRKISALSDQANTQLSLPLDE